MIKLSADPVDSSKLLLDLNGQTAELDRTDFNDALPNTRGFDVNVYGGDGNDRIENDVHTDAVDQVAIYGDAGNDILIGGGGVYAHVNPFTGLGGISFDQLDGGDGDDLLVGGAYTSQINGGAGDDAIFASNTTEWLVTGAGNDVVHGAPSGGPWYTKSWYTPNYDQYDQLFIGQYVSPPWIFGLPGPGPGDRQLDSLSGGDLKGPGIALIEQDVLVIHGTQGDDTAHLWLSSNGKRLAVLMNGQLETFDASLVSKYAFDAQGGNDQLIVHDSPGMVTGWLVRTANPDDQASVVHTQDPPPLIRVGPKAPPPGEAVAPETSTTVSAPVQAPVVPPTKDSKSSAVVVQPVVFSTAAAISPFATVSAWSRVEASNSNGLLSGVADDLDEVLTFI